MASAARVASAQEANALPSIDVRTFRASTDPRAGLLLEPTVVPKLGEWNVGIWGIYANRPVEARFADGARYRIAHDGLAELTAGVGLGGRAAFGVSLPFRFFRDEDRRPAADASLGRFGIPSAGIGDLALHGKANVVDNTDGGLGLAALGVVTVPTGQRDTLLGEGSVTASARALVELNLLVAGAQASVGYLFRTAEGVWPSQTPARVGAELPWRAGVWLRPGVFKIDRDNRHVVELAAHGSLPAGPVLPFGGGQPGSALLSPVMLAVSDRVAIGHYRDFFLAIGVDFGLRDAAFAPNVRGMLGFGWAPRNHDMDRDGVNDDVDQCPEIPEDRDGFEDSDGCPEIDDDEDGIIDTEDACPRVAGEPSDDPAKNGCPAEAAPGGAEPDATPPGAP